jgi:hypothetical protein
MGAENAVEKHFAMLPIPPEIWRSNLERQILMSFDTSIFDIEIIIE